MVRPMRVLLLLAFGLPVLVAQSLVARVELQSGETSVVSGAPRELLVSRHPSATPHPLVHQAAWTEVAKLSSQTQSGPEGSTSRALIFVQHHRRQAT
jgi:hypothetical protein